MSLFRRQQRRGWTTEPPIPVPGAAPLTGSVRVSTDTAMRHSAVWAALRLRANLISTMPVDVYRRVDGRRVEVPTPPVLVNPGGDRVGIQEWLYSTQVDLDRAGNAFGVITERDGAGRPARIDLAELSTVGVVSRDGEISYRIDGRKYEPYDVWHERQYTIAGLDVGLSPVAYAAWSIGAYQSAQTFALDWFRGGALPAAALKNKAKTLNKAEAAAIKASYQASVEPGGLFVHGNDWELSPIASVGAQSQFIELMQYGVPDIARFFDVPSDMLDAAVSGSSITYANITQRNLQLLITSIGPAVSRRENALTKLTPAPRFVKLNRDSLLAMDPETRARVLVVKLESRQLAPSEARAIEDREPYTPEQIAEINALYGAPRTQPTGATS